jgi:UrcA family protein
MTSSIKITRPILTRAIPALIVGFAVTGLPQSAAAAPQMALKQVEVLFGDLNLNKEAGATTLLRRLSKAARDVCDFSPWGNSNLNPKNRSSSCLKATLQKAVADVNHPLVTALYQNTRGPMRTRLASR